MIKMFLVLFIITDQIRIAPISALITCVFVVFF